MQLRIKTILILAIFLIPYITAQSLPDIYIKNVQIFPEKIYEGDQVRVTFIVGNAGSKAENIEIALFVDNRTKAVDEVKIDALESNEEKEITLYWFAEEGEHTLFIFADYNGKIEEENEDNNFVSIDIYVEKPTYPPFPPLPYNATWWDSRWHYRVPISVSMIGEREGYTFANKMVYCNINFSYLMDKISYNQAGSFAKRTFYPNSVRVIEYMLSNNTWIPFRNVGREIIFSHDYDAKENANITLIWVMEDSIAPHERRYYYIYWDTVENGYKKGEFGKIGFGIKNGEFEEKTNHWKNVTEGPIKWNMGYAEDPIEHDQCYKIYARGLYGGGYVWLPSYAKIYQNFKVPDEGQTYYMLHAKVYVYSSIDGVEWSLLLDGQSIQGGYSTGGWIEINKNITNYLKGKNFVTLSFKLEVTQSVVTTESHEVYAYLDSFWIETPNVFVDLFKNESHGWWAEVKGVDNYIAGVEGKNAIERIEVESSAFPKEVVANLYSPKSKLVKVSMPFPDPSFEEDYTHLLYSDEQTTVAKLQTSVVHSGEKAVELRLNNYEGKWEFEKEKVKENDMAGFRQNITYGISVSNLPPLYFWYCIEKFSQYSYLNYTLLTVGTKPKFHTIYLADLVTDGEWHKYEIPEHIIDSWKKSGGKVVGIEMRLVANAEGAENTIYIDDLGYSFMPEDATNRRKWYINDFYEFTSGTEIGKWRLDIILSDGSDYRVEKSFIINVDAAANLDIFKVDVPDLKEGETGKFIVYVKNHGPRDVSPEEPVNVTLAIYQEGGDYIKMRKSFAGLEAGETKQIEFEWQATYGKEEYNGEWNVLARVNEKGRIPEWEMKDNWFATYVKVLPMPDLKIDMEDVTFLPSNPAENETINISIIVHNLGFANATAKIRIYEKRIDEDDFVLLTNESIEKFIERKGWEKLLIKWKAQKGIYNIKVEIDCENDKNLKNNMVIKDIRIGKVDDYEPPVIKNIRFPSQQAMGKYVNISATIFDNDTTIDKAVVVVFNDSEELSYNMKRIGCTDIFYANITFNFIGYYEFIIKAFDTATWQNMRESEKETFRIVYEDIETEPPTIKAVSIQPPSARQVVNEEVNISAYIDDESGLSQVILFIIYDDEEIEHEMKKKDKIYYYADTYKPGVYYYYIKAVDASANLNYNVTAKFSFEIPEDYDLDDVPDLIEISLGANPKNRSQTINVSIGKEMGYLLWIEKENRYIYWDRDENKSRNIKKMDIDGDGKNELLFDVDGDGIYDYYYSLTLKEVRKYGEKVEKKAKETIWIIPPFILFVLMCLGFLFIKKK